MTNSPSIGPMLRLVLGAGAVLQSLAVPLLKRRVAKGKEDPNRWREKLGHASAARPEGPLIWMHGVGVGEVMALRGLITTLLERRPDLHFLVTSSARASGEVFAKNLPPRTTHQFLALDLPHPVRRFLDHWRPDLAVWSDQEVWPRLAVQCQRRAIPQAYVAARITDASAKARARFGNAYGDLYRLLDLRHAQDQGTANNLARLMGDETPVHVTGSLKAASAPLSDNPPARAAFEKAVAARRVWVLASSHSGDEAIATNAHSALCATDPSALLVIAPRNITRAPKIMRTLLEDGFEAVQRSTGALPSPDTSIYVADTFAELGLWYRSASAALIGGTFDTTEGHNPWEPIALGCPVLHGPRVRNFATDFATLQAGNAARLVNDPADVVAALLDNDLPDMAVRASALRTRAKEGLAHITTDLLALLNS